MFFRKKSKISSDQSLSALSGAKGIPLNNVKVSSGVTDTILSSILANDISSYEAYFKGFVMGYYAENLPVVDEKTLTAIYDHAIGKNGKGIPIALITLIKAQQLDGEIGAIVQNAIVYAIAMCISSERSHPEVRDNVDFATRLPNTNQPNKTPEQHVKDMTTNNPRAGVIAWSLSATSSKDLANSVVARMDYLLFTCEYDKQETEEQLVNRIFNETKL